MSAMEGINRQSREAGRGLNETKRDREDLCLKRRKRAPEHETEKEGMRVQLISASSSMAVMNDLSRIAAALAASEQHTHAS